MKNRDKSMVYFRLLLEFVFFCNSKFNNKFNRFRDTSDVIKNVNYDKNRIFCILYIKLVYFLFQVSAY